MPKITQWPQAAYAHSNCEVQHVSVNGWHCSLKQDVQEVFITCCYECNIHHENL